MKQPKQNKRRKGRPCRDWTCDGMLLLLGGVLNAVFSYNTSPLYPGMVPEKDAAFFLMAGRLTARGGIPYVDFFDSKGPLFFLIQALGLLIWDGKFGVFLLQVLFSAVSCLLMFRIARLFLGRGKSMAAVILALTVLAAAMMGGNFTEEFSLPFALLPVYLAVKTALSGKTIHPWKYAGIYGLCFGVLALIRITNACTIFGAVLFYVIFLLAHRQWKNLLQNMAAFSLGTAAVVLPVFLWYSAQGAFAQMWEAAFVFPQTYATVGFNHSSEGWRYIFQRFTTLLVGVSGALLFLKKQKTAGLLALCMAAASFFLFLFGYGYLHYFIMMLPSFLLGVVFLLNQFGKTERHGNGAIGLLMRFAAAAACAVCFVNYCGIVGNAANTVEKNFTDSPTRGKYALAQWQGGLIPPQEQGSVWSYHSTAWWMFVNKISPCFRYCDYQESFSRYDPQIAQEINEMLADSPPKWIIITTGRMQQTPPLNTKVKEVIQARYTLMSAENGIEMYRRSG